MARALLILVNDVVRDRALSWIKGAPVGTRVTFQEPKRTLPQNDRMWAMLTDIAKQKEHFGQRYTPDDWKKIILHALGREARFVPALDGQGFIPLGQSSSDLSKAEMADMTEFMFAWGAENGIVWSDPTPEALAKESNRGAA